MTSSAPPSVAATATDAFSDDALQQAYRSTREFSELICAPLSAEDCMVQSMDDVSPTRWHLAHTTWFFETFVLKNEPGYRVFDESFNYLFNSYYNSIGKQFSRGRRGTISRPGLEEIRRYRAYVDEHVLRRFESPDFIERMRSVLTVGLQHEQQHQELMLTDIKHVLSCNPTFPVYQKADFDNASAPEQQSITITSGNYEIGHHGSGFGFDNEYPRHQTYLTDCAIHRRLVTCGEFLDFIDDGGYERPDHWLSLGWSTVENKRWNAPLYWTRIDNRWMQFTLAGLVPINPDWPVTHISLFEADAFARWQGKRLPTEFEWEIAANQIGSTNEVGSFNVADEPFADVLFENSHAIHPTRSPRSLLGGVWEWTSSSYQAYPGYAPPPGAIGEYNGKFMCNQYVLRGGSVATLSSHIRPTYRNFFPAEARWQFTGLRLAE